MAVSFASSSFINPMNRLTLSGFLPSFILFISTHWFHYGDAVQGGLPRVRQVITRHRRRSPSVPPRKPQRTSSTRIQWSLGTKTRTLLQHDPRTRHGKMTTSLAILFESALPNAGKKDCLRRQRRRRRPSLPRSFSASGTKTHEAHLKRHLTGVCICIYPPLPSHA